MFVTKDCQATLWDIEYLLPDKKRRRIEESWAGAFREHILPLLIELEPTFAPLYHPSMGAPNKSVAVMIGLNILQDANDLSDAEVVDNYENNLQWHYAFDVRLDSAYLSIKTIYNFRRLLFTDQAASGIFKQVTDRITKQWNLRVSHNRLDSTHVFSNMAHLSRLTLFSRTITMFLRALGKHDKALLAELPERFATRYLEREGYFADVKRSNAKRQVQQCAEDVQFLLFRFRDCKSVARLKPYGLLFRLFNEQCEVPREAQWTLDSPVIVKPPKLVPSDSLQNPSDPDATYSAHKGRGYQAQVAETCHKGNPFQVISYVETEGAHNSDTHAPRRVHEDLKARGHEPETTYVDAGYVTSRTIQEAQEHNVDLYGPLLVGKPPDSDEISLAEFELSDDDHRVVRCPAGQAPVSQSDSKRDDAVNVRFDKEICDACPLAPRCPAEPKKTCRVLRYTPESAIVARRRVRQETDEFKEAYKIRSQIEGTHSTLKHKRGLRRLRVRGSPAVSFRVAFKALAENCFRVVRHVRDQAKKAGKTGGRDPEDSDSPFFAPQRSIFGILPLRIQHFVSICFAAPVAVI